MIVSFSVEPEIYFCTDADALAEIGERIRKGLDSGIVDVHLNFSDKVAEYCWRLPEPGNYLWQEDDYESVLVLWEELGRPVEEEIE